MLSLLWSNNCSLDILEGKQDLLYKIDRETPRDFSLPHSPNISVITELDVCMETRMFARSSGSMRSSGGEHEQSQRALAVELEIPGQSELSWEVA